MITVERWVPAGPDEVFAVLRDGWLYPLWVVGAAHMRDVDPGWPAVGTRVHHGVGMWPLMVRDATEVAAMEPNRLLELTARAWPVGAARVRLDLEPEAGGTRVTMGESAESGPAALVPEMLQALAVRPRNAECLARLHSLVVRRADLR
jgi:uncharacterized protein YndB with AHSA1/START domain